MDLVQTIRKEGSRGGRADFKWEDVKNDAQRENYLGHSLMAPVGRWQQGRDLTWYAKGDAESRHAEAARIAQEKRKLKEAEEDAMLAAMGLPVPERGETNANLTPLGKRAHHMDVKDALDGKLDNGDNDRSTRNEKKKEPSRRHRDADGERRRRHRSRSRSRDHHRDRRHRHRHRSRSRDRPRDDAREDRRHGPRSQSRREHRSGYSAERETHKRRSRSASRDRRRRRDSRSRSPYPSHDRRRG